MGWLAKKGDTLYGDPFGSRLELLPIWPLAQRTMIMQLQQLDLTTEVGISDSIDKCSCGNLGFTSH